ncbi:hypothetical protein AB0O28_07905 [Microbispora sp. NPDC088329]|uniref:hypothetical protein n=1 Tax=Microbispora sp. NPDC088329 TaxID=3154869 RepID=UPI0034373FB7
MVKVLASGLLAFVALFLTAQSYLFSVFEDDWGSGDSAEVDPDMAVALLVVLVFAAILATGSALIQRRYKTTWIVYGIFSIIWAIRFLRILPYYR